MDIQKRRMRLLLFMAGIVILSMTTENCRQLVGEETSSKSGKFSWINRFDIGFGIFLSCKRKRLGTSNGNVISFSRFICAAKMTSCAWPAIYPISKLKRNSTENSTEINKKFRPRQFEYHPSDASLMVFETLDGKWL